MLTLQPVGSDDPDRQRLWEVMWAELKGRYGYVRGFSEVKSDSVIASFVGYVDGTPMGTVTVRFASFDGAPPVAEIKRLFVLPEARGRGYSRVLMGVAEESVRRAGATRIVLETGKKQPEAIALYRAIGYAPVPHLVPGAQSKESISMAKELPTRVLVISGTIGAGKTTVAWAVSDVLADRGVRHAVIEGDALAQGSPAPAGDPYNQELLFAGLKAVAPLYRDRGWGCIIIPRVVEDDGDRGRYAEAFAGPAGPAQVSIVRVLASEETRSARLHQREPEGRWRDWALNRTVELEAILDEAGVEDATIDNDGDVREVAIEVLEAVGW